MKVYLDTSVLLAWLLEGGNQLQSLPPNSDLASSRLLWVETARVMDRAFRSGELSSEECVAVRESFDATARGICRLRVNESVLRRAEASFPLSIRTLDGIHLATAVIWLGSEDPSEMEIWTLDRHFNLCAAAMGFRTPWR
ncbi:MAG: type II toxin-antitoxin system VapC family toxin [Spirochaetota bacterium]